MSAADNPAWHERCSATWTYWPALLGSVLVALTLPWYLGLLDIDLEAILWGLLVCCALVAVVAGRSTTNREPHPAARAAPYLIGIALLSGLWYVLGTFRSPGFLILLAIPVFAAGVVSKGWLEYGVAAFGVAGSTMAGIASSPALRWYVESFALYPDWLGATEQSLFLALDVSADAATQALMLAHFAIAIVAAASVAGTTGRTLQRLTDELVAALQGRRESDDLAHRAFAGNARATALVAPVTGRIVSVNQAFRDLGLEPAGAEQRLRDVLAPLYPERLESLCASADGGNTVGLLCRPQGGEAFFDVSIAPATVDGVSLLAIGIERTHDAVLAVAALQRHEVPLLAIGPGRRVLFANAAFAELFPGTVAGSSAAEVLEGRFTLPPLWWDVAPAARAEWRFFAGSRGYTAVVSVAGAELGSFVTIVYLRAEDHA